MHPYLQAIIDAIFPVREDVAAARSLDEATLARAFHPRLAREAWIVALFPYRDADVRAFVRATKFYGETTVLPVVGQISAEYLLETIEEKRRMSGWDVPLLVPMPLSPRRERERGYNQVARFAEAMLPHLEGAVSYAPRALDREHRESQVRKKHASRADNIYGAFFVPDRASIAERQVILLDDVVESGATMKDARRALTAAGVTDVLGIAIAH